MSPIQDLGSNGTSTKADKDSPWKVSEDGTRRERQGRLLPFEAKIRELLVGVSGAAAIAGDQFVSAAIDSKRDELAYGYAKLAKENSSVKRVLELLFTGSAWAEALIPTVGLVAIVGWHYGMVPDQVGVPLSMASGVVPMSREAEVEMRKRMAREAAAEAEGPQTHDASSGQNKPTNDN